MLGIVSLHAFYLSLVWSWQNVYYLLHLTSFLIVLGPNSPHLGVVISCYSLEGYLWSNFYIRFNIFWPTYISFCLYKIKQNYWNDFDKLMLDCYYLKFTNGQITT